MKSSLIVSLLAANLAVAPAVHAGTAAIWKLSDDNSTVYLAGSVHLLRERDMPYPKTYDTVYEDSEELVFEIDMKEMNAPGAAIKMRQLGTLPTGKTLGDHLSQETLAALDGYLKANNLPAGMFNQFTPGMVYLTLGSMEALRQGARPDLGIEMQFHKKAEKDGKPGSGLETTAYQMSRFNELDVETLNELIKETIEASDQNEDTLNSIIEAWKSGDAERLQKLVHDEMAERPAVLEILLVERNQNWIPVIEEKLAGDKNVMFIVGAAHLVGEGSVVQLLEDKGHKPVQLGTDK
ncbi:MAG: TraB/GumN family protein [Verrucomicrobiota bacterium]|nr:TraB/GumN family protein [Verrucomicrobiota bacterium]